MNHLLDPILWAVMLAYGVQDWTMWKRTYAVHRNLQPDLWAALESFVAFNIMFFGVDLAQEIQGIGPRELIALIGAGLPVIARRLAGKGPT
jgi:hypothetical protein